MLVLTRKIGESIRIGHDIEVVVLPSSGDQVRLGISAPRHVAIHRSEVFERLAQENLSSAGQGDDIEGLPPAPASAR